MNSLHNIIKIEQTGSTNEDLSRMASEGCETGTVLVADMQTQGKGRRGRTWYSPKGTSLSFSLLLRPSIAPEKASMITLLMAMAVYDALHEDLPDVKIKWPNDLVISGKKVCGILTQMRMNVSAASEAKMGDSNAQPGEDDSDALAGVYGIQDIIVGCGINVNQDFIPEELKELATSIFLETGKIHDRDAVLSSVLSAFDLYYESFLQTGDLSFMKVEYNNRLINKDAQVKVLDPKGEYEGRAFGIDKTGNLLVEDENKQLHTVYAGEVSVRGVYGYV